MPQIFVSYSRKDEDFARKLAQSLKEIGAEVWIDVENIPAGANWSNSINEALKSCVLMLLIISPDAMSSEPVNDEWQYFHQKKKPIIPILYKPAELHFQLERKQYIDFQQKEYQVALEQLCNELQRYGISTKANMPLIEIPGASPIIKTVAPAPSSVDLSPDEFKKLLPDLSTILPPPFEWCVIPAGEVTIEYSKTDHQTFHVPTFAMAKYPITNAQYQVFEDAKDGYQDAKWWDYSDDARAWRAENKQPVNTAFEGKDLPRTNVTWFEAVAFCRWLHTRAGLRIFVSGELVTQSILMRHIAISLPTEQQWQRAAQGSDGRIYPWGDDFILLRCNTAESGNRKVTSVIQYPNGVTPFGVMDMAGNTWDWCLTTWEGDQITLDGGEYRVARGGSWDNYHDHARVMYHSNGHPELRFYNVSIRLVCCHISIK
jgi:formylglycine-generating enzyme required for sulfatase activity